MVLERETHAEEGKAPDRPHRTGGSRARLLIQTAVTPAPHPDSGSLVSSRAPGVACVRVEERTAGLSSHGDREAGNKPSRHSLPPPAFPCHGLMSF